MADDTVRSLQGVRVLALPDPKLALCCKLLADMGADVVAVEPPEGSALRSAPPRAGGDGESLLFWYGYSRARSVECDLASTEGRDRFVALAVKADVLLEALPPGRLNALGVEPEVLAAANPGLIHLSATDFGGDGPFRDFKGSDIVAWAMGGLMGLTGDPAREPLTAPAPSRPTTAPRCGRRSPSSALSTAAARRAKAPASTSLRKKPRSTCRRRRTRSISATARS